MISSIGEIIWPRHHPSAKPPYLPSLKTFKLIIYVSFGNPSEFPMA